MSRSGLSAGLSIVLCCCAAAIAASQDHDGDWRPISITVNDVAGVYRWRVNWDLSFHYSRFDKVLPDGSALFVNRQVDRGAWLPTRPLVSRDSPGIDGIPNGANVSMTCLPPSKRLPGCGGEVYRAGDGKTAHQRDWDALVALRDKIFGQQNVSRDTSLRQKVRLIADWTREPQGGGLVYESKRPVDVALHKSFCVGQADLFVAIMHTMDIPAPTINVETHSVAEVLLDGRSYVMGAMR